MREINNIKNEESKQEEISKVPVLANRPRVPDEIHEEASEGCGKQGIGKRMKDPEHVHGREGGEQRCVLCVFLDQQELAFFHVSNLPKCWPKQTKPL